MRFSSSTKKKTFCFLLSVTAKRKIWRLKMQEFKMKFVVTCHKGFFKGFKNITVRIVLYLYTLKRVERETQQQNSAYIISPIQRNSRFSYYQLASGNPVRRTYKKPYATGPHNLNTMSTMEDSLM